MNKDEFKKIIEPVVNRNDCMLWGFEILRGKKRTILRIYIDSNKGVDINDCENVSKDLGYEPMLDLSLGDNYVLEVSTPGVDRKFFNILQLSDYIGENLEFKTRELIEGKRKFTGTLINCDDNYFSIKKNDKSLSKKFKFSDLDLCKLKPDYNNLIKEYSYEKQ
tara:strand:- start:759 stop:1250 length:492 start_codon:yes stop_codon:yes gene_type:complete